MEAFSAFAFAFAISHLVGNWQESVAWFSAFLSFSERVSERPSKRMNE